MAGGNTLTIHGSNFGTTGSPNVASVTIGSVEIPYGTDDLAVDGSGNLELTLPAGAQSLAPSSSGGTVAGQDGSGLAEVVVTLSDGVSSMAGPNAEYSYVDETSGSTPSVSSISPYAGADGGGTQITIYGSGFDGLGLSTNDTVTVGGVAATNVNAVNPWEIKATTPASPDSTPGCATEAALVSELTGLSNDTDPMGDNICQTEVIVTDTGTSNASAPTAPLPTYLGELPSANQDGILMAPSGFELTPVSDEFDYVPTPTITDVGANTTDGNANAQPGSYGAPSVLEISGTGLNYQTMNWLSFGDPTTAADQDISYPAYADGTNVEINAPADPNGPPASGSDPDTAGVTAYTLGGHSTYDSSCTDPSVDCVTYAGLPEIDSVTALPSGLSVAPDTGGTHVVIGGAGLSDVVGPLQFEDDIQYVGLPNFSIGTQYQYTNPSDAEIDTQTVSQNPAIVDTYACSDSGCSAQSGGDELLLYPPGDPKITSVQDASGPALGGTLVTINGENLGCVTSISFGSTEAEAFGNAQALLDCGSTTQVEVVAPPGSAGQSVPITLSTVESEVTGDGAATSPTNFAYDTVNPGLSSSVSFGSVNLGQTSTETVTLSNPAAATQPLFPEPLGAPDANGNQSPLSASIGGSNAGDFTITNDGCSVQTLDPTQSCSFQVQFAPRGLGSRSATLDIPFNYSQSVATSFGLPSQTPDLQTTLNGTGAEPTNTVTTPGTTTTKTVTKTIRKTCTITVRWRWVTVKVHGKKKREHKKFVHRSKGCKKRR